MISMALCKTTITPLLTHWGRMTHICVSKLTIIGSDNGLSPGRRQAIIWTNAGILLIGPLRTNVSEMLIEIHTFSFKKMHLKMWPGRWRPFCLGLNVLMQWSYYTEPSIWCMCQNHQEWVTVVAEDNLVLDRYQDISIHHDAVEWSAHIRHVPI